MRIPLLKSLALAGVVSLAPVALAQQPVTVLFNFEGTGGDTQGWMPTQDSDSIATNTNAAVETLTQKAINGQGGTIPAFDGTYLLEARPSTPLKARTYRGAKYSWSTAQNWTATPVLKLAASMNARNADSERHEFRIRIISGTGATADTTEKVFAGLKSEEFDNEPNNTFVNEWEVLELDLTGFAGIANITQIEAAGRNVDDGTETAPGRTNPTPGPDGNWGGNVHVDYVTVEPLAGTATDDVQPGLRSLSAPYPNPTTGAATLDLTVETGQRVTARVIDVLGRTVQTAFDGAANPGSVQAIRVETGALAAGTYVVVVEGETFRQSRRITVTR